MIYRGYDISINPDLPSWAKEGSGPRTIRQQGRSRLRPARPEGKHRSLQTK